jgi:hypothetical protein
VCHNDAVVIGPIPNVDHHHLLYGLVWSRDLRVS